jgi:hypothetical protein
MSYALYTQRFNDFLRRSRQKLTADVQCIRFINGMANFELRLKLSHIALREVATFTLWSYKTS